MACEESPLRVHWEVSLVETVNILCACECVFESVRERHSCGIVSRPAGRHQDNTNTHRFTTFSFILPFP